jgi:hypothetical protein
MTVEAVRVENSESLSPRQRRQLFYTFGNHMHWVDMEWLWGYFVLPSSVRDMLAFCDQAGIKGNVNFDAVGYEKLAVEAPEALAELRAAIAAGIIEVAGGSYAQPYGQFHGCSASGRRPSGKKSSISSRSFRKSLPAQASNTPLSSTNGPGIRRPFLRNRFPPSGGKDWTARVS